MWCGVVGRAAAWGGLKWQSIGNIDAARVLYAEMLQAAAGECVEVVIRAANFERRVVPGDKGLSVRC